MYESDNISLADIKRKGKGENIMSLINLDVDWKEYYKEHLVSFEEAAKHIEPGDVIFIGQATMVPAAFLDYLYEHKEDYHDVTIIYNVFNTPVNMIFDHDTKEHFRLLNFFNLPLDRMAMDNRTIEVLGAGYDQYEPALWQYGCNTAAFQLCPPNADGWCNVGCYTVTSYSTTIKDPKVVKKFGFMDATGIYPAPGPIDTHFIHITEFDYIIENNTDMMYIPAPEPTEVDKRVAAFIMPHIHDGDKVQIGFGGLGEEILRCLNDLPGTFEVFSEVACDSMLPLVENGKITKVVASSPGACSQKFFEFLSESPKVTLVPRTIAIDPLGVMQQDNLVAINATFMVDLLGQACSEAQGLKPYTGAGGSFAYMYGTTRSNNGRSFLCLRSTYKTGSGETKSNIVPWLPEGSIVTTPKNYVMFIVSEWGIADVYLRTYTDRIKALIRIAHPEFREWLKEKILTTPLIEEWDFRDYDMFEGVEA